MAAFVVGQIEIHTPEVWKDYSSQVDATITANGGEIVFRGAKAAVLNGTMDRNRIVVLRFADKAAAQRWHDSPEYQRLIPLRDGGANVTLVIYEN